ncbi:MAG: hypothetical protein ACFE8U_15355 [Candidatus Hermodarchaeota archaeon]
MDLKKTHSQLENMKKTVYKLIIAAKNISEVCSQLKLPPMPLEKKIQLAKENLNDIFLTEDQKKIAEEIIEELTAIVPLHDFVLKGFLWRSIKKWQLRYSQPIILVSFMNRNEQLNVGLEILSYLQNYLSRAMFIPDKNLKKQFLEEIYRRLVDLYEELLSVCTFLNDPANQEYILDFEIENWFQGNHSLL